MTTSHSPAAAAMRTIEVVQGRVPTLSVAALRPHPRNESIYGDGADDGLVDSVRAKGVLTPLLVTADNVVISGHRRLDAARRAGLKYVPVSVFGSADAVDILDALLHSNRQRQKDGEQIGREYTASLEVEAAHAKRRQQDAGKDHGRGQKLQVNSPEAIGRASRAPAPQAGDRAAQRIGTSRQKAERAAAVNGVVADLLGQGKTREAERLRRTLKTTTVHRAYSEAKANGHLAAPAPRPVVERAAARPLTVRTWLGMGHAEQQAALHGRRRHGHFNRQTTTNIEWARWSWNPVTGCEHGCAYCYARDIAEGDSVAFPTRFTPTFLPERLDQPRTTHVPAEATDDIGYRNVFTCSMADLFGRWVPTEWIEAVLDAVRANPQWNFLFLTKFPIRLQEFEFPDNAWLGTTVDAQARVANVERAFATVRAKVKWLSCEPLLEPLRFERLDLFQWVVMGGASRSTQTPEWRPPFSWIADLYHQARTAGCEVYCKTNLLGEANRLREYPGHPEPARLDVPAAFKMGYLQRDVLEPDAYASEHARAAAVPHA